MSILTYPASPFQSPLNQVSHECFKNELEDKYFVDVMKEVTIIAKNDVGALAAVAEALGGVGVNIEAISAYGRDNEAIFRLITNDPQTVLKTMAKVSKVKVVSADVIVLKLINRPGELGKVTRKLANQGINLESLYIVSRKHDFTEVAVKPESKHFEKAKEVLGVK
ncbi:MAG: ACT domain-containing protein [Candidatus Cloacimonadia bacterium]